MLFVSLIADTALSAKLLTHLVYAFVRVWGSKACDQASNSFHCMAAMLTEVS